MATAETVDLGPPHAPKEDSIIALEQLLPGMKRELLRLRHDYNKHEPEYFSRVSHLSDAALTAFTTSDLTSVRAGMSAYGVHVFGKLRIPETDLYLHIRFFGTGSDDPARFHCFHTEETVRADGDRVYRAVFTEGDELEWFDT